MTTLSVASVGKASPSLTLAKPVDFPAPPSTPKATPTVNTLLTKANELLKMPVIIGDRECSNLLSGKVNCLRKQYNTNSPLSAPNQEFYECLGKLLDPAGKLSSIVKQRLSRIVVEQRLSRLSVASSADVVRSKTSEKPTVQNVLQNPPSREVWKVSEDFHLGVGLGISKAPASSPTANKSVNPLDMRIEISQPQPTHREPALVREANGTDSGVGLGLNIANNSGSNGASSPIANKSVSPLDMRIEISQPQPAQREPALVREANGAAENNAEIRYPSRLDGQKHVSADLWAITLVRQANKNHTQLAIEGVENNQPFLRVAHFGGKNSVLGIVKYSDVPPEKFKVGGQDITHLIPREPMQNMIDEIVRERDDSAREEVRNEQGEVQEKDRVPITNRRYPRVYSSLGHHSKYSPPAVYVEGEGLKRISAFWCSGEPEFYEVEAERLVDTWSRAGYRTAILDSHNCTSWAIEKMSMLRIPVPRTNLSDFANLPQYGTNESGWNIIPTAIKSLFKHKT